MLGRGPLGGAGLAAGLSAEAQGGWMRAGPRPSRPRLSSSHSRPRPQPPDRCLPPGITYFK